MWQALRNEVFPLGVEIVTVAMDTAGADAARPFVERAAAEHPSLVDVEHSLGRLFGVVNVPNAVWIDEAGMIVRPAEPAWPGASPIFDELRGSDDLSLTNQVRGTQAAISPALARQLELTKQIVIEPALYKDMLLDWAHRGADSPHALAPDEVVRRSAPRTLDTSAAAAHFELGQHLFRSGRPEAAVPHWREAHRLQPDNWTYKRQAWRLDPAAAGGASSYDGNWTADVAAIGPENYYPRLQP